MAELDARSDVPHDKEESSSGDGLVSPLFSRSVTTNGDKQLVSLRGELDIASLPGLLDWLIEISGPTDDRRDIAAHLAPAKTSRGSQPRSYFALTFRGPTASKSAETGTAWFRLTIIVSGSWSATSLERASALPRSWPDFDLRFGHTFSKDIRRRSRRDILPPVRYRHGRTHVNGAGGSRRQRIGSTGRGQRRPPGSVRSSRDKHPNTSPQSAGRPWAWDPIATRAL